MDKFEEFEEDGIIDPEIENALDEVNRTPIEEQVTILNLMNGMRVKIRYKPRSMGHLMEATNGVSQKVVHNPKFRYEKWAKEVLPKLNSGLLNVRVVDDLSGKVPGKGELRFSLIDSGEYKRLYGLVFPGYAFDPSEDSGNEDNADSRKVGKGVRRVATSEGS